MSHPGQERSAAFTSGGNRICTEHQHGLIAHRETMAMLALGFKLIPTS